jgi:hypothetical protein
MIRTAVRRWLLRARTHSLQHDQKGSRGDARTALKLGHTSAQ